MSFRPWSPLGSQVATPVLGGGYAPINLPLPPGVSNNVHLFLTEDDLRSLDRTSEYDQEQVIETLANETRFKAPRGITDEQLTTSVRLRAHLKHLDVSECYKLTDESIGGIAGRCPALESLNVSCCGNLTDVSIQAIAENCPALTDLNVNGCRRLTDVSIRAIAEGCPALEHLNVLGCNLTDVEDRALKQQRPALILRI